MPNILKNLSKTSLFLLCTILSNTITPIAYNNPISLKINKQPNSKSVIVDFCYKKYTIDACEQLNLKKQETHLEKVSYVKAGTFATFITATWTFFGGVIGKNLGDHPYIGAVIGATAGAVVNYLLITKCQIHHDFYKQDMRHFLEQKNKEFVNKK